MPNINPAPLIPKLSFLTSTQKLTGRWLDAIQKSTRFDGKQRSNTGELPSDFDESVWATNQRDAILDWEISDEGSLGSVAWGGRILATDGESYYPPGAFQIGTDYFVWIKSGSFISLGGDRINWATSRVQIQPLVDQYIFLNTSTNALTSSTNEPPVNSIVLAKLKISSTGIIEYYDDLRSNSVTVDLTNRTPSLLISNGLKNADYVASNWERILTDTSLGGLFIDLPLEAMDNSEVSIVDSEGYFHLYPVLVRPVPDGNNLTGRTINGVANDVFALNRRYGVYTFVFSAEKNGWYSVDSQQSNTYKKGSFISCGGRQYNGDTIPITATSCVAGQSPPEYLGEENAPLYENISSKCWLLYNSRTALYSNPEMIDNQGIKVEFNSSRCINTNHKHITGGNSGFNNEEVNTRATIANRIVNDFFTTILPVLGNLPSSKKNVYFELNSRISYSIRIGYWQQVREMESPYDIIIGSTPEVSVYLNYLINNYLEDFLLEEFNTNTSWLLPPLD